MVETPWHRAKAQQRSKQQEQALAKRPGGRKQVNSGRHWFSKRDVRLNGFLIEARTTNAESYRIDKEEFEKVIKDALATPPGMLGAMLIEFPGLKLMVTKFQDHEYMLSVIASQQDEIARLMEGGITQVDDSD
jgi:hypothetical protein